MLQKDIHNYYLSSLLHLISTENMEDKMKWIKNYERVQEVQRQLSWPLVTELDSRIFIPEVNTLIREFLNY